MHHGRLDGSLRKSATEKAKCPSKLPLSNKTQTADSAFNLFGGKTCAEELGSALLIFWVLKPQRILLRILRRDTDNQIKIDGQFTSL